MTPPPLQFSLAGHLGTERKAVQKFTEDLIQKRKDASPLFRTVAIRKPSAPKAQTEANVKVYRKKDETDPLYASKPPPPLPLPTLTIASPFSVAVVAW